MADNTVTLKTPLEHEDKIIESVTINDQLKAKDLLAAEAEMMARGITAPGSATQTLYIAAQATGLDPDVLREMALPDYVALSDRLTAFLS